MTFLKLANVSKSYAGAAALSGAGLEIAPGEIHALMGENGAGKSTIIKILAGVTQADSIDLFLDGRAISTSNAQDAFGHGFRFLHQELNIVPHLSVAENIVLGRRYPRRLGFAVNWAELNHSASAALEKLQVTHIEPGRKMARLSTGDQMLVKIAGLLVSSQTNAARLYVMDEPTAALTGAECDKLFQVIAKLKAGGASVLYVSHRMNEVMDICDRVTVFRNGQTVATRNITATNKDEVIHLMTGRDRFDVYPPRKTPVSGAVRLSCRNLATRHIRDLNFDLGSGEILGITGLADAGQSQVLHAILGLDRLQNGALRINGSTVKSGGATRAWRSGVAYIPRERRREGLMLRRSIADNIVLPHLRKYRIAGGFLSRRREIRHANSLGVSVALKSEGMAQPVYQLSGGNQQKTMLARATGDAPEILLLDEPTRGVDVGSKFDIYSLIREMSARGTTVIITSSDLPEIVGMCDRILIMQKGAQHSVVETGGLHTAELLAMFYD